MRHVYRLFKDLAENVRKKGQEIKFVYGDARVALSFILEDPEARWAYIAPRVTLYRSHLAAEPTGYPPPLPAATLVNPTPSGQRWCLAYPGTRRRHFGEVPNYNYRGRLHVLNCVRQSWEWRRLLNGASQGVQRIRRRATP